jgi:uncharacterized protein YciI
MSVNLYELNFRSRAAAEAYAQSDPFYLEGAVKEY